MHFGLPKKINTPDFAIWTAVFVLSLIFGCKDESKKSLSFAKPDQGQNFNIGDEVTIKVELPKDQKVDSISYYLDSQLVAQKSDETAIKLPTIGLQLGYRVITAIVKSDNQLDTIKANIVLRTNQVPKQLTYKIIKTYPHDTTAYTEGLAYVDGKLLESTGENGASELKWVELNSGKTLQKTKLDPQYFGEGSLKIGDKIIMLTWRENIGFIFDAKTLKQLGTFPYENSREGWGLTFDGKNILRSDGTNRIWYMNATTYKEERYLEVYDNNGEVSKLNELEYIDGKIYANVYETSKIVIINPATGIVESEIQLAALVPKNYFKTADEQLNNVLNGIAWDAKGKRLFVVGKKWPKLYELKLN